LTTAKDEIKTLKGHWLIQAYKGNIRRDERGNVLNELVWEEEGDNVIATGGKDLLLDRLFALSGTPAAVADMGVGTDLTAATAAQTKLNPSVAGSVQINAFDALPTRSAETVTCVTTYPASGAAAAANFSWNELGLFNGTVNGTSTMFNRIAPIGPFTKTSAVSIAVTVTIQQS
jgi:hypothetical protein